MSNKIKHPEAWNFFIEHARNIECCPQIGFKYSIPEPNLSGNFIYANDVGILWQKFIQKWYEPNLNSESVSDKIQYIVQNFKG